MYFYDRENAAIHYYDKADLEAAISEGEFMVKTLASLSTAQNQWVGRIVLDGVTPSVDYGYDQLIDEIKRFAGPENYTFAIEEKIAMAATRLHERFKGNLNPTIAVQRSRLERMSDFVVKISEVDPISDFVVINQQGHIIKGLAVFARAIMDMESTVNVCRVKLPIKKTVEAYTWTETLGTVPGLD